VAASFFRSVYRASHDLSLSPLRHIAPTAIRLKTLCHIISASFTSVVSAPKMSSADDMVDITRCFLSFPFKIEVPN
jgi:hypothetical protein